MGVSGSTGANFKDFVGARPVEQELGLEDLTVRVRLRALADGDGRIEHPHSATNGEFWNRAQCVREGRVSAFHARNCEDMVFADDIVRALLAVGRQVAAGEVVAGQALMTSDPGVFENREREARKPTHVDLVGS